MKAAAIYGAGGHARVISSILRASGISILGFFDDSYDGSGEQIQGKPILGTFADITNFQEHINAVYIAIGDNKTRKHAFETLETENFDMPPLIHPGAFLENDVLVGKGSVVCMGATLATEVKVGRCCIVNTGASVDHESRLGDFVHIAPKAAIAGRVTIGDESFVGIGAAVAEKLALGDRVIVGANSVVLANVPSDTRALGVWH